VAAIATRISLIEAKAVLTLKVSMVTLLHEIWAEHRKVLVSKQLSTGPCLCAVFRVSSQRWQRVVAGLLKNCSIAVAGVVENFITHKDPSLYLLTHSTG